MFRAGCTMIGYLTCVAIVFETASTCWGQEKEKEAVKKDLEQLQGEWLMKSGSADGFAIPEAMMKNFKRVCKGDETVVTNGEQLVMKARITIDPSKKPKAIDYEIIDGPTKGKKHLGIYEIDGDTLKSCFGAPDTQRPTEFTSKSGDRLTLTVWRRAKKQQASNGSQP